MKEKKSDKIWYLATQIINIMPNPGIKNAFPWPKFGMSYCALKYLGSLERREEVLPGVLYKFDFEISYYKCLRYRN